MKKIISIILSVCMLFGLGMTLISCGGSDGTPVTTVTADEWAAAFAKENFMKDGVLNVTVTMDTSWDGKKIHLFADGKKKCGDSVEEGWDIERFIRSDYSVLDFADAYEIFSYDEARSVYVANAGSDESFAISFLDKKLVSCTISLGSGADAEVWTTSYSDIGETAID